MGHSAPEAVAAMLRPQMDMLMREHTAFSTDLRALTEALAELGKNQFASDHVSAQVRTRIMSLLARVVAHHTRAETMLVQLDERMRLLPTELMEDTRELLMPFGVTTEEVHEIVGLVRVMHGRNPITGEQVEGSIAPWREVLHRVRELDDRDAETGKKLPIYILLPKVLRKAVLTLVAAGLALWLLQWVAMRVLDPQKVRIVPVIQEKAQEGAADAPSVAPEPRKGAEPLQSPAAK
jgi:hypothetical protein